MRAQLPAGHVPVRSRDPDWEVFAPVDVQPIAAVDEPLLPVLPAPSRTRLALLFVPGLVAGCVGLPLIPFAGLGLLVWGVALVLIGVAHGRVAQLQDPG